MRAVEICGVTLLLSIGSARANTPTSSANTSGEHGDAMQVTKVADFEIRLTRKFAAPPETVFATLTQSEHLQRWMQAAGMTLVSCEVDLRPGGSFRYTF